MSSLIMLGGIVRVLLATDSADDASAAASCITILGAVLELVAVRQLSQSTSQASETLPLDCAP